MGSPMSLMPFAIDLYNWATESLQEGKRNVAGLDLYRSCAVRHNQSPLCFVTANHVIKQKEFLLN